MKFFSIGLFFLIVFDSLQGSTIPNKRSVRALNATLQTHFNGSYLRRNPCNDSEIERSSYSATHEFNHHTKEADWSDYAKQCTVLISNFLRAISNLISSKSGHEGTYHFNINTTVTQTGDSTCDATGKKWNCSSPTIIIQSTDCDSPDSECKCIQDGSNGMKNFQLKGKKYSCFLVSDDSTQTEDNKGLNAGESEKDLSTVQCDSENEGNTSQPNQKNSDEVIVKEPVEFSQQPIGNDFIGTPTITTVNYTPQPVVVNDQAPYQSADVTAVPYPSIDVTSPTTNNDFVNQPEGTNAAAQNLQYINSDALPNTQTQPVLPQTSPTLDNNSPSQTTYTTFPSPSQEVIYQQPTSPASFEFRGALPVFEDGTSNPAYEPTTPTEAQPNTEFSSNQALPVLSGTPQADSYTLAPQPPANTKTEYVEEIITTTYGPQIPVASPSNSYSGQIPSFNSPSSDSQIAVPEQQTSVTSDQQPQVLPTFGSDVLPITLPSNQQPVTEYATTTGPQTQSQTEEPCEDDNTSQPVVTYNSPDALNYNNQDQIQSNFPSTYGPVSQAPSYTEQTFTNYAPQSPSSDVIYQDQFPSEIPTQSSVTTTYSPAPQSGYVPFIPEQSLNNGFVPAYLPSVPSNPDFTTKDQSRVQIPSDPSIPTTYSPPVEDQSQPIGYIPAYVPENSVVYQDQLPVQNFQNTFPTTPAIVSYPEQNQPNQSGSNNAPNSQSQEDCEEESSDQNSTQSSTPAPVLQVGQNIPVLTSETQPITQNESPVQIQPQQDSSAITPEQTFLNQYPTTYAPQGSLEQAQSNLPEVQSINGVTYQDQFPVQASLTPTTYGPAPQTNNFGFYPQPNLEYGTTYSPDIQTVPSVVYENQLPVAVTLPTTDSVSTTTPESDENCEESTDQPSSQISSSTSNEQKILLPSQYVSTSAPKSQSECSDNCEDSKDQASVQTVAPAVYAPVTQPDFYPEQYVPTVDSTTNAPGNQYPVPTFQAPQSDFLPSQTQQDQYPTTYTPQTVIYQDQLPTIFTPVSAHFDQTSTTSSPDTQSECSENCNEGSSDQIFSGVAPTTNGPAPESTFLTTYPEQNQATPISNDYQMPGTFRVLPTDNYDQTPEIGVSPVTDSPVLSAAPLASDQPQFNSQSTTLPPKPQVLDNVTYVEEIITTTYGPQLPVTPPTYSFSGQLPNYNSPLSDSQVIDQQPQTTLAPVPQPEATNYPEQTQPNVYYPTLAEGDSTYQEQAPVVVSQTEVPANYEQTPQQDSSGTTHQDPRLRNQFTSTAAPDTQNEEDCDEESQNQKSSEPTAASQQIPQTSPTGQYPDQSFFQSVPTTYSSEQQEVTTFPETIPDQYYSTYPPQTQPQSDVIYQDQPPVQGTFSDPRLRNQVSTTLAPATQSQGDEDLDQTTTPTTYGPVVQLDSVVYPTQTLPNNEVVYPDQTSTQSILPTTYTPVSSSGLIYPDQTQPQSLVPTTLETEGQSECSENCNQGSSDLSASQTFQSTTYAPVLQSDSFGNSYPQQNQYTSTYGPEVQPNNVVIYPDQTQSQGTLPSTFASSDTFGTSNQLSTSAPEGQSECNDSCDEGSSDQELSSQDSSKTPVPIFYEPQSKPDTFGTNEQSQPNQYFLTNQPNNQQSSDVIFTEQTQPQGFIPTTFGPPLQQDNFGLLPQNFVNQYPTTNAPQDQSECNENCDEESDQSSSQSFQPITYDPAAQTDSFGNTYPEQNLNNQFTPTYGPETQVNNGVTYSDQTQSQGPTPTTFAPIPQSESSGTAYPDVNLQNQYIPTYGPEPQINNGVIYPNQPQQTVAPTTFGPITQPEYFGTLSQQYPTTFAPQTDSECSENCDQGSSDQSSSQSPQPVSYGLAPQSDTLAVQNQYVPTTYAPDNQPQPDALYDQSSSQMSPQSTDTLPSPTEQALNPQPEAVASASDQQTNFTPSDIPLNQFPSTLSPKPQIVDNVTYVEEVITTTYGPQLPVTPPTYSFSGQLPNSNSLSSDSQIVDQHPSTLAPEIVSDSGLTYPVPEAPQSNVPTTYAPAAQADAFQPVFPEQNQNYAPESLGNLGVPIQNAVPVTFGPAPQSQANGGALYQDQYPVQPTPTTYSPAPDYISGYPEQVQFNQYPTTSTSESQPQNNVNNQNQAAPQGILAPSESGPIATAYPEQVAYLPTYAPDTQANTDVGPVEQTTAQTSQSSENQYQTTFAPDTQSFGVVPQDQFSGQTPQSDGLQTLNPAPQSDSLFRSFPEVAQYPTTYAPDTQTQRDVIYQNQLPVSPQPTTYGPPLQSNAFVTSIPEQNTPSLENQSECSENCSDGSSDQSASQTTTYPVTYVDEVEPAYQDQYPAFSDPRLRNQISTTSAPETQSQNKEDFNEDQRTTPTTYGPAPQPQSFGAYPAQNEPLPSSPTYGPDSKSSDGVTYPNQLQGVAPTTFAPIPQPNSFGTDYPEQNQYVPTYEPETQPNNVAIYPDQAQPESFIPTTFAPMPQPDTFVTSYPEQILVNQFSTYAPEGESDCNENCDQGSSDQSSTQNFQQSTYAPAPQPQFPENSYSQQNQYSPTFGPEVQANNVVIYPDQTQSQGIVPTTFGPPPQQDNFGVPPQTFVNQYPTTNAPESQSECNEDCDQSSDQNSSQTPVPIFYGSEPGSDSLGQSQPNQFSSTNEPNNQQFSDVIYPDQTQQGFVPTTFGPPLQQDNFGLLPQNFVNQYPTTNAPENQSECNENCDEESNQSSPQSFQPITYGPAPQTDSFVNNYSEQNVPNQFIPTFGPDVRTIDEVIYPDQTQSQSPIPTTFAPIPQADSGTYPEQNLQNQFVPIYDPELSPNNGVIYPDQSQPQAIVPTTFGPSIQQENFGVLPEQYPTTSSPQSQSECNEDCDEGSSDQSSQPTTFGPIPQFDTQYVPVTFGPDNQPQGNVIYDNQSPSQFSPQPDPPVIASDGANQQPNFTPSFIPLNQFPTTLPPKPQIVDNVTYVEEIITTTYGPQLPVTPPTYSFSGQLSNSNSPSSDSQVKEPVLAQQAFDSYTTPSPVFVDRSFEPTTYNPVPQSDGTSYPEPKLQNQYSTYAPDNLSNNDMIYPDQTQAPTQSDSFVPLFPEQRALNQFQTTYAPEGQSECNENCDQSSDQSSSQSSQTTTYGPLPQIDSVGNIYPEQNVPSQITPTYGPDAGMIYPDQIQQQIPIPTTFAPISQSFDQTSSQSPQPDFYVEQNLPNQNTPVSESEAQSNGVIYPDQTQSQEVIPTTFGPVVQDDSLITPLFDPRLRNQIPTTLAFEPQNEQGYEEESDQAPSTYGPLVDTNVYSDQASTQNLVPTTYAPAPLAFPEQSLPVYGPDNQAANGMIYPDQALPQGIEPTNFPPSDTFGRYPKQEFVNQFPTTNAPESECNDDCDEGSSDQTSSQAPVPVFYGPEPQSEPAGTYPEQNQFPPTFGPVAEPNDIYPDQTQPQAIVPTTFAPALQSFETNYPEQNQFSPTFGPDNGIIYPDQTQSFAPTTFGPAPQPSQFPTTSAPETQSECSDNCDEGSSDQVSFQSSIPTTIAPQFNYQYGPDQAQPQGPTTFGPQLDTFAPSYQEQTVGSQFPATFSPEPEPECNDCDENSSSTPTTYGPAPQLTPFFRSYPEQNFQNEYLTEPDNQPQSSILGNQSPVDSSFTLQPTDNFQAPVEPFSPQSDSFGVTNAPSANQQPSDISYNQFPTTFSPRPQTVENVTYVEEIITTTYRPQVPVTPPTYSFSGQLPNSNSLSSDSQVVDPALAFNPYTTPLPAINVDSSQPQSDFYTTSSPLPQDFVSNTPLNQQPIGTTFGPLPESQAEGPYQASDSQTIAPEFGTNNRDTGVPQLERSFEPYYGSETTQTPVSEAQFSPDSVAPADQTFQQPQPDLTYSGQLPNNNAPDSTTFTPKPIQPSSEYSDLLSNFNSRQPELQTTIAPQPFVVGNSGVPGAQYQDYPNQQPTTFGPQVVTEKFVEDILTTTAPSFGGFTTQSPENYYPTLAPAPQSQPDAVLLAPAELSNQQSDQQSSSTTFGPQFQSFPANDESGSPQTAYILNPPTDSQAEQNPVPVYDSQEPVQQTIFGSTTYGPTPQYNEPGPNYGQSTGKENEGTYAPATSTYPPAFPGREIYNEQPSTFPPTPQSIVYQDQLSNFNSIPQTDSLVTALPQNYPENTPQNQQVTTQAPVQYNNEAKQLESTTVPFHQFFSDMYSTLPNMDPSENQQSGTSVPVENFFSNIVTTMTPQAAADDDDDNDSGIFSDSESSPVDESKSYQLPVGQSQPSLEYSDRLANYNQRPEFDPTQTNLDQQSAGTPYNQFVASPPQMNVVKYEEDIITTSAPSYATQAPYDGSFTPEYLQRDQQGAPSMEYSGQLPQFQSETQTATTYSPVPQTQSSTYPPQQVKVFQSEDIFTTSTPPLSGTTQLPQLAPASSNTVPNIPFVTSGTTMFPPTSAPGKVEVFKFEEDIITTTAPAAVSPASFSQFPVVNATQYPVTSAPQVKVQYEEDIITTTTPAGSGFYNQGPLYTTMAPSGQPNSVVLTSSNQQPISSTPFPSFPTTAAPQQVKVVEFTEEIITTTAPRSLGPASQTTPLPPFPQMPIIDASVPAVPQAYPTPTTAAPQKVEVVKYEEDIITTRGPQTYGQASSTYPPQQATNVFKFEEDIITTTAPSPLKPNSGFLAPSQPQLLESTPSFSQPNPYSFDSLSTSAPSVAPSSEAFSTYGPVSDPALTAPDDRRLPGLQYFSTTFAPVNQQQSSSPDNSFYSQPTGSTPYPSGIDNQDQVYVNPQDTHPNAGVSIAQDNTSTQQPDSYVLVPDQTTPGENNVSTCDQDVAGPSNSVLPCPFSPEAIGNMTAPSYYILVSKISDDYGDPCPSEERFRVEKVYLGDGTPLNCSFSQPTFPASLYKPVQFSGAGTVKLQTSCNNA